MFLQADRKHVCNVYDVVQNLADKMLLLSHQHVAEATSFLAQYQSEDGEHLPDIRGPGLGYSHSVLVGFLRGMGTHSSISPWVRFVLDTLRVWRERLNRDQVRGPSTLLSERNYGTRLYSVAPGKTRTNDSCIEGLVEIVLQEQNHLHQ